MFYAAFNNLSVISTGYLHANPLLVAGNYPTSNRGGWRKSPQEVGPAGAQTRDRQLANPAALPIELIGQVVGQKEL